MLKLAILILGLVIGFGGGVYWASHNPEQANQISAEEERRFLEAQMQITQKLQEKLDQLGNKTSGSAPAGGRSTLVSQDQPQTTSARAEVNDLKADTQKQQEQIRKHLDGLK